MSGIGNRRFNPRWPYGASFFERLGNSDGAEDEVFADQFFTDETPNAIGAFSIEGSASATFTSATLIGPSPGVLPSLWFKRDDVLRVVLVEIDSVSQTGSGAGAATETITKYIADHHYFDEENGRTYRGCINSLPRFNRAIDRKTLRGRFTSSIGSIEIDNQDGEYDDLLTMACDASEVRFYIGDGGDPISARQPWLRSEFMFVFSALAVKVSVPTVGRISIALRDSSLLLEKTIGGTVAIGGTGVNAEKFRPKNFGLVHNITCPLKDFGSLTYVYNETGGALVTLLTVRCRGDSIAYVDNGDGTFSLLANPAGGLVTADVLVQRGGVSVPMLDVQFTDTDGTFRLSDAFQQIVGTDAGLSALGKYAGPSTNFELNWSNDYHVGVSIAEPRDLTDVVDELCTTGNVYCAVRRDGMFTFGWVRPEALDFPGPHVGSVVATIANGDLVKGTEIRIEHADPSEAFYSVQGYGNVNWTPQTDLALGLAESVAETYRRKGFYAAPQDGTDPTGSYSVPALVYNGPWDSPGYNSFQLGHPELYHKAMRRSKDNRTLISCVLDTEADIHVRRWESVNRTQRLPNLEFVDVTVDLTYCNVEIGNVVELDVTEQNDLVRFGFSGKKHQVVSIDIALTERVVRLGLVRRRPAVVDIYYAATAVTIQARGTATGTSSVGGVGDVGDVGDLVVELLMESYSPTAGGGNPAFYNTAPGAAVTTPELFGVQSGSGVQSSTQAFAGTYSAHLQFANIASNSNQRLTIGTRGFRLGGHFWWNSPLLSGAFGNALFMFDTAGVCPLLYLAVTTGFLTYSDNSSNLITTAIVPSLNTWHEIYVERLEGSSLTTLYYDGAAVGSATDASNYVAGTTLRIGSFGNTAGAMPDFYVDNFFFYNAGP